MWHHAVSQCRGIEDVETGKKHCVDPTARYPSKFHFDHLTIFLSLQMYGGLYFAWGDHIWQPEMVWGDHIQLPISVRGIDFGGD